MSRDIEFAKKTGIIAIGTFLPKLASFFTLPILTGYLTKEEYGTYDLITIMVSLLLPVVTLQIQAAAFRMLIDIKNDKQEIRKIISNILFFINVTSLITLIILYFCLFKLDSIIRILICLYYFADINVNAVRQIARGLSLNLKYSVSAIVSAICKLAFVIICVYLLNWGLCGTVLSLFLASLISFFYLFTSLKLYVYLDIHCINTTTIKEMLEYSWPLVPNGMSTWVMRLSDRVVVTMFLGVATNAVYAVANKLPALLTLAQTTFTMAWQEHASIVSKDEDAGEYYSHMFRVLLDLMAGFFCILIASTPLLFRLLIKGDYWDAYVQIPILFFAVFFYSMSSFLGGIYVAYKQTKSIGITTVAAAICNIVVNISLIKWIGLYAASGSTLVSYLFLFAFRIVDVQKFVKVKYDLKHIIIIVATMFLSCILLVQQKYIYDIVNIMLGCSVFIVLNRSFIKTVYKMIYGKITNR